MFSKVRCLSRRVRWSITICFWVSLLLISPPIAGATTLGDLAASMQPGTWAKLTTTNIATALTSSIGAGVHPTKSSTMLMAWFGIQLRVKLYFPVATTIGELQQRLSL